MPTSRTYSDPFGCWLLLMNAGMFDLAGDFARKFAPAQRLHSGYLPKAQRNAVAHGLYSMGVRKAPRRETAADQAQARAVQMGLAS